MVKEANVSGVNFTAAAQQTHSVALSWDASPTPVAGYNVYRSTVSGSQFARVNSALIPSLAFTDTGVRGGWTYYYVTTAVDLNGGESAPSNQVAASIP
jgi:fibronectin type 3 domain-containing protein